jgi:hypothetical protein
MTVDLFNLHAKEEIKKLANEKYRKCRFEINCSKE